MRKKTRTWRTKKVVLRWSRKRGARGIDGRGGWKSVLVGGDGISPSS